MDPLSITAGTIAVLSVVNGSLRVIDRVYHASDDIKELIADISDVRCVLERIHSIQQEQSTTSKSVIADEVGLVHMIQNAAVTLEKLKEATRDVIKILPDQARKLVTRMGPYKESLNRVKTNLLLALAVSNSSASQQRIIDIEKAIAMSTASQQLSQQTLLDIWSGSEKVRRDTRMMLPAVTKQQSTIGQEKRIWDNLNAQLNQKRRRNACEWGCNCVCHRQSTWLSTSRVTPIIGNIAVEVVPPIATKGRCDQKMCQKSPSSSVRLNYRFPWWLLRVAISVNVEMTKPFIYNITCRAVRILPDSAPIFYHAREGNLEQIKLMLADGKASVYDVDDSTESSALTYATDAGHIDVWRFLLQAGADPYHHGKSNQSTMDVAFSMIYRTKRSKLVSTGPQADIIQCPLPASFVTALIEDYDVEEYLEHKAMPRLQKIVLGIFDTDLETQLRISTADIDEPDYHGWTALAWAAVRGDVDMVKLLLAHGADPNLAALDGGTPLIRAARASNPLCIEPLIEYQADVNAQDKWGVTPLMNSIGNRDDPRYLLPLIHANADLELTDKIGRTVLVRAVSLNRVNAVRFLMENGAQVTSNDLLKMSLGIAIEKKFNELVEILLPHSDRSLSDCQAKPILESVDEHCDVVVVTHMDIY